MPIVYEKRGLETSHQSHAPLMNVSWQPFILCLLSFQVYAELSGIYYLLAVNQAQYQTV